MDNLFPKGSPTPSWLRKLTLQWCMQEGQVAVVIIAAKSSQNLPTMIQTVVVRGKAGTAVAAGGWGLCAQWHRMWLPQLWCPAAHSRWDCEGVQAGWLQELLSSL